MADSPYQRSINQAAKAYEAAANAQNLIADEIAKIPPAAREAGGPQENQFASLQQQLTEANKRFIQAEQAYQDAIQLADKSAASAKEFIPAGQTRTRLDTTAGNVLVAVTETSDGRGGWSVDPTSVKRVDVQGDTTGGATRINAPSSDKKIVSMKPDGSLVEVDNPNYQPDRTAGPQAVPTSEYIYQNGQVVENPAYRPPAAEINTTAPKINDPKNPGQFIDNPNYQDPNARLTAGQRAVDTATAATAGGTAEANLAKAQTDARTAQLNLEDAQRRARQAPTDAQAQQAIATAQRQLDLANQQLEQAITQAGNLNPIAVDQAKATLARSQQLIQKDQLGDLYGRQEQIRQIKSLVQSGEMSPAEADMAVSALNRGTTVFDAQKQMQADRSISRGQDVSNRNQLAGTFGSTATSIFNTLSDMNKYAKPGSDSMVGAFVDLINLAQSRLKDYGMPPAQDTNYLGPMGQAPSPVSSMVNAAQQQLAAAPVAQPPAMGSGYNPRDIQWNQPPQPAPVSAPAPSPAQPITINIGGPSHTSGGGEAAGGPPVNAPMPSDGGNMLASAASRGTPVRSADEIYKAYGVM
jgi:hypothetical protein